MSKTKFTHHDIRFRTVARYSANGELIAPPGQWVTIEGVKGSSVEIEGVENGTTYEIQVRAVNADGARPWSNAAMATPSAGAAK